MAWNELTNKRNQRSKTWQDSENLNKFSLDATLATLHYEDTLDSGIFDTSVDTTPIRVNNAQFDGWRITKSGWHYALGKDIENHGDQDGWIGFGGRKGQNWFKFRLARVGYLHWPTKDWDDIGGTPNYDRQNLIRTTDEIEFPTDGSTQPVSSKAIWNSIWTTPQEGDLSVSWRVNGDGLKEEITLNQAGREWMAANRPPTTPLTETYFGFVLKLDWSDIPKVLRKGVLQNIDGDFADDDENIELRDALDRLLAFMPISDVIVPSDNPDIFPERQPLRKRFYKDGANHYLFVGIRCDTLNGMSPGDLIFDPSLDYQVSASTDDATEDGDAMDLTNANLGNIDAADEYIGCRWLSVTIPDGATINAGTYASLYFDLDGYDEANHNIWFEDAAAPTTFTSTNNDIENRTPTTATVLWDEGDVGFDQWNNTYDLDSIITELMASYSYAAGSSMVMVIQGIVGTSDMAVRSYDHDTTLAPKLHIEYTAAAAAGDIKQIATLDWAKVKQLGTIAEANLKQVATIDAN